MILNADQVENSTTWLLNNGSVPVRYLTHKHLLGTPGSAELMQSLWREVEESPAVQEIFSKQEPDGSWCAGGSWAMKPSYVPQGGWDPITPKYVTTVWVLPLLGEMGYTAGDARIRRACDYVLSHGYFTDPLFGKPTDRIERADISLGVCRFAQYMIALGSVGLADDPMARKGYQVLLRMQRDDGGWVLPEHYERRRWTRSCPWSTYHATMALYASGDLAYGEALRRGLQFLVWHLGTKEDRELQRFFYHGHSTVRELLLCSEFGIGRRERAVQAILAWLMTMYRADQGFFHYAGKPISQYSLRQDGMDARVARYRLYHLVEDDWLTYYMTRIARNWLRTP